MERHAPSMCISTRAATNACKRKTMQTHTCAHGCKQYVLFTMASCEDLHCKILLQPMESRTQNHITRGWETSQGLISFDELTWILWKPSAKTHFFRFELEIFEFSVNPSPFWITASKPSSKNVLFYKKTLFLMSFDELARILWKPSAKNALF